MFYISINRDLKRKFHTPTKLNAMDLFIISGINISVCVWRNSLTMMQYIFVCWPLDMTLLVFGPYGFRCKCTCTQNYICTHISVWIVATSFRTRLVCNLRKFFFMCAVNGKHLHSWFASEHLAFWDVSQVICSISSAKVDSVTYTELVYLQVFVELLSFVI